MMTDSTKKNTLKPCATLMRFFFFFCISCYNKKYDTNFRGYSTQFSQIFLCLAYGTDENVNLDHWLSLPRGKVHLSEWPVG